MKSEEWFVEYGRYVRSADEKQAIMLAKYIYTEGRWDQGEADLMVVDKLPCHDKHPDCDGCEQYCPGDIMTAIRAAGPGEGE